MTDMGELPHDTRDSPPVQVEDIPNPGGTVTPMGTLTAAVLRYIGDRLRRGEIQPVTARGIRNHLLDFSIMWGHRPLDQLSHKAVERWVERMQAREMAPGTINGRLSSLRCFARWCATERITVRDWTLAGPKVRRPRGVARDVNNAHFWLVLAEARDAREEMILWLMFDAGCRCIEVHRLDVEDVERDTMQVFLTGKAGHQRYVPISQRTLSAVDRYLEVAGHRSGALVRCADRPGRLGPERISGIVGRMFRTSGVKIRSHDGRSAHGLRAAAASDLYEQCGDPRLVAEFLGHADMQSLSRYVRRGTLDAVRSAQSQRSHARGAA